MYTKEKVFSKGFIEWLIYTFLFGMLPLIFLLLTSMINGDKVSLITMSKELFFLTIILCADALKALFGTHNNSNGKKIFLHGITIFILVITSVLYGIILINKEIDPYQDVYKISAYLCAISVIVGVVAHKWGEQENTQIP